MVRTTASRVANRQRASTIRPCSNLLREVHAKLLPLRDGAVASYIPELAKVDPDQFGIALVTADGFVYEVGDSRRPFTIQSISKPLVYGLALQDHGREGVLTRIGVEPSGDSFNSIVFDDRRNRPFNTMVNTGAIAATSLIKGKDAEERFKRVLDLVGILSGRPAQIDTAVYRSEMATGHRNRAIALSRTEQRHDRGRCRSPSRSLFPALRHRYDGGRSRLYRRDLGARRPPSADRETSARRGARARRAERDDDLRNVRLRR